MLNNSSSRERLYETKGTPGASTNRGTRAYEGKNKLPYGDFENVHRCAVVSAESEAGQHKLQSIEYHGVESAAAHLHGMIDAIKR